LRVVPIGHRLAVSTAVLVSVLASVPILTAQASRRAGSGDDAELVAFALPTAGPAQ